MSDYKKDFGTRRDYDSPSEKRYSSEGRVLRPRKKAGDSSSSSRSDYGEHRGYSDRKVWSSGDRDHRSDGDHKPYGQREGSSRNGGYGRSEGSYGQRNSSDNRPYGQAPREHRPYNPGGRKPYGQDERSGFSQESRKPYGQPQRKPYGQAPHGKQGYRPSGRKGGYRKDEGFGDHSGIDRMLDRRPQVDKLQYSDFDSAPTRIKDEIRLNKFIANSGVCSRREADTLIQAGVVTVNGQVVTELGTKVNIHTDDVRFNGERLRGEEKVYVVMNKPKGYVTTASDPHAEKTVMDLLKDCKGRVFPVGRLDKSTTGVLMFTNDGEIAERLTHPSYDKKKIYQVLLDRPLQQEDYEKILSGVDLVDGPVKADELEYIEENDLRKVGIEIHSGKNRIVRRIFESLGYDVRALDRVYFAGLTKKGLKKGEWRYLSEGEVNILKMGAYV